MGIVAEDKASRDRLSTNENVTLDGWPTYAADQDGPDFVALLPGSPAITAGQTITDDVARTDQRGYARALGGPRTDIGAYELIDFAQLKSVWLPVLSR